MKAIVTLSALLLTVLVPGRADAQDHQHQSPAAAGTAMMGMHGTSMTMAPDAAMILRLRGPLGLTEAQIMQIESARDRSVEERRPHLEAAGRARSDAAALLDAASPDLAAYQAKLEEATRHEVLATTAQTRGWIAARQALTPEQASNLRFGMRMMPAMMQEMMPMMQGMMGNMPARMPGNAMPDAGTPRH